MAAVQAAPVPVIDGAQEVKMAAPAGPVAMMPSLEAQPSPSSPPAYASENGVEGGEKQLPREPEPKPAMVAAIAAPTTIVDNAISVDAIRMTYLQYVTIQDVKKADPQAVPTELSSRGLTVEDYAAVLTQVKQIKSKSDGNKIALWTGMIFMFGIIGYLLVSQRAVGNKPLRKQLELPLEDVNRKLMSRGVAIRWTWIEGSLRAYYK